MESFPWDSSSSDLLSLDGWGQIPVVKGGLQILFRVTSDSYESKGLIRMMNLA